MPDGGRIAERFGSGVQIGSFGFAGLLLDGKVGLIGRSGSSSFDDTRLLIGWRVQTAIDPTPPTLTIPGNVSRVNDPGSGGAWISDATLGSASASDNVIGGLTVARTGVPAGNVFAVGVTQVVWTATDAFGNTTVKTQLVTVLDTEKPTLTVPSNRSFELASGSTLYVSDAQLGTASGTDNSGGVTVTRSGVPAGNLFAVGTTTITYKAVDAAGNTTTLTQTVTIYRSLALSKPANQASTEGTTATFALGSLTGGLGGYTLDVSWGDGTSSRLTVSAGSLAAGHRYGRSGSYAVTATVTDSRGVAVTQTFTVTIANAAPRTVSITPLAGSSYGYGAVVPLSVAFTDAGPLDTHTCTISWGDGSTTAGTIAESNGSGFCTASHPYPTPATYTITVTVRDSAGATATITTSIKITNKKATGIALAAGTTRIVSKRPAAKQKVVRRQVAQLSVWAARQRMM